MPFTRLAAAFRLTLLPNTASRRFQREKVQNYQPQRDSRSYWLREAILMICTVAVPNGSPLPLVNVTSVGKFLANEFCKIIQFSVQPGNNRLLLLEGSITW